MPDFLIAELDDRLEFGVAIVDNDSVNTVNDTCANSGNCCDKNMGSCENQNNCQCPACKS